MYRQVKQCQNDECNYIHVQASKTMSKLDQSQDIVTGNAYVSS